jgi:hypothetical protein
VDDLFRIFDLGRAPELLVLLTNIRIQARGQFRRQLRGANELEHVSEILEPIVKSSRVISFQERVAR